MAIEFRSFDRVAEVGEADWNFLADKDYPFTRYEFLHALEETGAVSERSGWLPHHLGAYEKGSLVAVLPSYVKQHSYGEYVFDHAWANAYHQYGIAYYPKLVTAIPFTPISGSRILIKDGARRDDIINSFKTFIPKYCVEQGFSGWHLLFPEQSLHDSIGLPFLQRSAVHFQWRNEGYHCFDDFLARFTSRKRKNLRKERASVAKQGVEMEVWEGGDIPQALWRDFYRFYQMTYAKRSGHGGYLPPQFFNHIAQAMPEKIVLVMAKQEGQYIAGALNFKSTKALYGRYWGCIEAVDNLHFEACYYQGIEYCIEHNLQFFDPGVQGEHKIQRGFRPTYTYSNHWLCETGFREPVLEFIHQESMMLADYFSETEACLPFKRPSNECIGDD